MVWRQVSNGGGWRFGGRAALWMLLLAAACSAGCDSANPGQKIVGKWREMTPAVAPDPAAPAGIVSSASADPPPGPAPSPQGPKWGNTWTVFYDSKKDELELLMMGLQRAKEMRSLGQESGRPSGLIMRRQ